MAEGVVYTAEVTDSNTGEKETYTGLTEGKVRQDRQARGQLPAPPPAWHQAVLTHLAPQGPGAQLHHQLENPDKGEHLQPLVRHVPVVHAGEVPHHVLPSNCLTQPERGDLLKL